MSTPTLILNNYVSDDPCTVCGRFTNQWGLDLAFEAETEYGGGYAIICDACGWRLAPRLQRIREGAYDDLRTCYSPNTERWTSL